VLVTTSDMMSSWTNLSAEEQLRARLAEQFIAKPILRMHTWREVLERTWCHPYVPGYYLDKNTPPVLCMTVAGRVALLVLRRPEPTSRGSPPLSGEAAIPPPLTQATRLRCHATFWRSVPEE
jgi:hypothetical protein